MMRRAPLREKSPHVRGWPLPHCRPLRLSVRSADGAGDLASCALPLSLVVLLAYRCCQSSSFLPPNKFSFMAGIASPIFRSYGHRRKKRKSVNPKNKKDPRKSACAGAGKKISFAGCATRREFTSIESRGGQMRAKQRKRMGRLDGHI